MEVEAEGLHPPHQRPQQAPGGALAAVGHQAVAHQAQVVRERRRGGVAAPAARLVARGPQAPSYVAQEAPVHLRLRARLGARVQRGDGRGVAGERLAERVGDRHLEGGGGEPLRQLLQLADVVVEDGGAGEREGAAGHLRRHVRVAVAVAADPRAEAQHPRQLARRGAAPVDAAEGVGHLEVQRRQGGDEHPRIVVEPHLHLVGHRRRVAAHLVRLPERGDLGGDGGLLLGRLGRGERERVQPLQRPGDAAALEQPGAPRHLGGVRREHGDDADLGQLRQRLVRVQPLVAQPLQGAAEGAGLRRAVGRERGGAAAALAVGGLGEVRQLEVDRERLGEAVRLRHRQAVHQRLRLRHRIVFGRRVWRVRGGLPFPVRGRQGAELLDGGVERVALLLADHLAEQLSEVAHVSAQGRFLQRGLVGGQFGQAAGLVVVHGPERGFV